MFKNKLAMTAAMLALAAPLAIATPSLARPGGHGGGHMGGGHMGGGHFGGGHFAGRPGGWHGGGGWRRGGGWGGGGFIPGAIAGAVIGGALAAPYYYDDSYGYYGDYYDDGPAVEVAPPGGDATGYCMQRFKSYDPASGTYLGYDGLRHPCP